MAMYVAALGRKREAIGASIPSLLDDRTWATGYKKIAAVGLRAWLSFGIGNSRSRQRA